MEDLQEVTFNERIYEDFIIDSDFHLHIPTEKLFPYIEDSSIREKLERCGPPPLYGGGGLTTSYAMDHKRVQPHDRTHGTAANSEEIREVCDELAIDVPIVQPGTNIELIRSNYPTLVNALTSAYNDYVLDKVVDVEEGIFATMMLPNWDVEFALEELDRVGAETGFVATQNWLTQYKYWGDIDYDPIFDKLTDLDLNLILHIAASSQIGTSVIGESSRTYVERVVGEQNHGLFMNVMNMVMTGVFDDYPDLKVSVQEAGSLWFPFLAYRMDEMYQSFPYDVQLAERLHRDGRRELDRMPSEYVFDNFYAATQPISLPNVPRSDHVKALLAACRAGQTFMYTSDWPHLTIDPAQWVYDTPGIDDEMRKRILHENSLEVLRIPQRWARGGN